MITGINPYTEEGFRILIWIRDIKAQWSLSPDVQIRELLQSCKVAACTRFYGLARSAQEAGLLMRCNVSPNNYEIGHEPGKDVLRLRVAGSEGWGNFALTFGEILVFVSADESRSDFALNDDSRYIPAYNAMRNLWATSKVLFWNKSIWNLPTTPKNLQLFSLLCT